MPRGIRQDDYDDWLPYRESRTGTLAHEPLVRRKSRRRKLLMQQVHGADPVPMVPHCLELSRTVESPQESPQIRVRFRPERSLG